MQIKLLFFSTFGPNQVYSCVVFLGLNGGNTWVKSYELKYSNGGEWKSFLSLDQTHTKVMYFPFHFSNMIITTKVVNCSLIII